MPNEPEHALELPIRFGQGSGVTRRMDDAEVCFATDVPLASGEWLAGTIGFPEDSEAPWTVIRYLAQVTRVEPGAGRGSTRVVARFERLGIGQPSRRT